MRWKQLCLTNCLSKVIREASINLIYNTGNVSIFSNQKYMAGSPPLDHRATLPLSRTLERNLEAITDPARNHATTSEHVNQAWPSISIEHNRMSRSFLISNQLP